MKFLDSTYSHRCEGGCHKETVVKVFYTIPNKLIVHTYCETCDIVYRVTFNMLGELEVQKAKRVVPYDLSTF